MATYALVIFVLASNKVPPTAVATVPGFHDIAACWKAGRELEKTQSGLEIHGIEWKCIAVE